MICPFCTFLNSPNTQVCEMCSKSLNYIVVKDEQLDGIVCDACTYLNDSDADSCSICGWEFYLESSNFDSDSSSMVEDKETGPCCSTVMGVNTQDILDIVGKTKVSLRKILLNSASRELN